MQKYHIQNPGKKGGKKNYGCDDGSPSRTISQRKHFIFLNIQQVLLVKTIL